MAGRKNWIRYSTMGAVALDSYYASTARPLPKEEPKSRPREAKRPAPARTLARTGIPALFARAVCWTLAVLTLFGFLQVAEANQRNRQLLQQVQSLEAQRDALRAEFDRTVDLDAVMAQAKALGMRDPERAEHIELEVPQADPEPTAQERKKNPAVLVWEAIRDTAESLLAYLRGK